MPKINLDRERIKDALMAASPMLVLLALVVFVTYRYIDPAPPKRVVISAGEPDGNYFEAAKAYKEQIKSEGIDLEILPSKGAWENLRRLEDPKSEVQIAFVQDGLGNRKKDPDVSSLGSIFYEPIWIFYRGTKSVTRLTSLIGKTIAVGEKGGETHTMAQKLLVSSGVTEENSHWQEMGEADTAAALRAGKVDVAFFIASANSPLIQDLVRDSKLKLMSLDQAEAMTRQFPYLHHLVLPHGTMDLKNDIPAHDIDLVAPTATLVVRKSLHPAIVYLMLKAASHVHHEAGVFEKKSEFPIDKDFVFPLNPGAKDFFKSGAPFWLKYLPFWLATLMERFIFLVLPTAALVIPLLKMIPRFLNWRVRSRIYKSYGELKMLEDRIDTRASASTIEEYVSQLDGIENQVHRGNFPVDVFDDVYLLREHIHFVRERLNRMARSAGSEAGARA